MDNIDIMRLTPSAIAVSCLLTFGLSALLTWAMRHYALHKAILDIPNERSSHQVPTPRGGGIAIVLIFSLFIFILSLYHAIASQLTIALIGGGLAIAVMGYCDDVYTIQVRVRIIVHFLVALWAVYWLDGFSVLDLGTWKLVLNGPGSLLAMIGIVWCTNLYNFMDGIDGLAGSEGFFVSVACALALWLLHDYQLAMIMWLLAAAILGFTVWNWPPAKIFLGDVGSGYLGFVFAVLVIHTTNKGILPITFWVILLAVFLCDATFTVIQRTVSGKKWYSAHREHAYQRLMSTGASHRQITTSILLINICILLPLAFAALYWPKQAFWLMCTIILGLWLVWMSIKSLSSRGNHETNLAITEDRRN